MSIRIAALSLAFAVAAATPGLAWAQANVMKECGAEYQSAKAANTLGGKSWNNFLGECRTRRASATPSAATATPATTPTPAAPPASSAAATPPAAVPGAAPSAAPAKPVSGGRQAMLDRQRTCAAEWKAQKVELRKADSSLNWPQYWSQCNKRLKAAGR